MDRKLLHPIQNIKFYNKTAKSPKTTNDPIGTLAQSQKDNFSRKKESFQKNPKSF